MLTIIGSEAITVIVSSMGAELHSIKNKVGLEYLWQADPKVWRRHAPVLFPFNGSPKNHSYTVNGNEYVLPTNHGFARDMDFTVIAASESAVTYCLSSTEETMKQYPFAFELYITYKVIDNNVHVSYTVVNKNNTDMYFYIGGHPAFNCPLDRAGEQPLRYEDYCIEYECDETIIQIQSDGSSKKILNEEKRLSLSHELFNNDVIFKDKPMSSRITLKSDKSSFCASVAYDNSGCIAVWAPASEDAQFVCLEPWSSIPTDKDNGFEALEDKPNASKLSAGSEYKFEYVITVY